MSVEPYPDPRIFACFAEMLDYPHPGLVRAVRKATEMMPADGGQTSALLEGFRDFLQTTPAGRLEEIYTATFDFEGAFHPYIGHHLLGDSYKRSALLVGLKERYRACGVEAGNELPDHLTVVLRFLAACDDAKLKQELISEALLPALNKMLGGEQAGCASDQADGQGFVEIGRPATPEPEVSSYRLVLEALKRILEPRRLDPSDTSPRVEPT